MISIVVGQFDISDPIKVEVVAIAIEE